MLNIFKVRRRTALFQITSSEHRVLHPLPSSHTKIHWLVQSCAWTPAHSTGTIWKSKMLRVESSLSVLPVCLDHISETVFLLFCAHLISNSLYSHQGKSHLFLLALLLRLDDHRSFHRPFVSATWNADCLTDVSVASADNKLPFYSIRDHLSLFHVCEEREGESASFPLL